MVGMSARPAPSRPDYRLDIGELVIDGFSGADPAAVTAALRRELARLLADPQGAFGAAPSASAAYSIRQVEARGLPLAADASPAEIGAAAARAIAGRLAAAPASRGAK